MKNTNTKQFKQAVFDYLIDSAYDCEDMSDAEVAQHIHDRWISENCYEYNVRRLPNHQDRLADWFAGLPLAIDYSDYQIIRTAKQWHGVDQFSENAEAKIIDDWFKLLAFKCLQMFRHYGVKSELV